MQVNGNHIRELRENLGMTAKELAAATSISPPFLSQIESGSRGVSPPVAARLAAALEVSISDLRRT